MKTYTKIEVAVKALLQAKELYLQADYVSATILAGAGQRLVRDVCERRGIESTLEKISNQSGFAVKEIHNLVVDCVFRSNWTLSPPQTDRRSHGKLDSYSGAI